MTLKLMTQQVLENFLVGPQYLGLIELSLSLVKRNASVDLLLIVRTIFTDCLPVLLLFMNKSNLFHEEDSIYKIGNSTISEQEITTKKCKCGSTSHLRTSHRDCPMNKGKTGK